MHLPVEKKLVLMGTGVTGSQGQVVRGTPGRSKVIITVVLGRLETCGLGLRLQFTKPKSIVVMG